jgi:RNA polymerase sigma-70 factor (ECF subfamily)
MAACAGGDLNALMDLLAPDVTSWSDGGGVVTAARRSLYGPDHVARWVLGVLAKPIVAGLEFESATINGELGVLARIGGIPVAAFTYDLVDGHIQNLRFQVHPAKLGALQAGNKALG